MHTADTSITSRIPGTATPAASGFLLRFNCLFTGRGMSFPCDASGTVDLQALSEPARGNLQRALSGVGRDYGLPQVVPAC
ncbi:hypothetical protein [Azohydromonas aeria]|uniref:hypothetical protein n=1 Tax=Azohydromonas aeria TaxID=2590212 RepID=UPI0012FC2616|nr:hypothetical protein [Azohydromonas aeria]